MSEPIERFTLRDPYGSYGEYVLAYDRLAGLYRKLVKHIDCDYYGFGEENPGCPCPKCQIKADVLALIGAGGDHAATIPPPSGAEQ